MATIRWRGDAPAVAQVDTVTVGGTIEADDKFIFTINGKSLSVTAGSTAAATVATTIATAWNALSATVYPEFAEITAAATSGGALTLTADTAGKPFTCTVSTTEAGGGAADSQTIGTVATTASSGPNHWDTAANWSSAAVPVNSDDVIFDQGASAVLYGMAQSAVTLTSLTIAPGWTGTIGLPVRNAGGYYEYRATYLAISATTVTVTSGSGRIKLDTGSVATTLNIYGTGQPAEANVPAMLWKGTHASNVLNVTKGSFAAANFTGEVATIATVRCGYQKNKASDVTLYCGAGVTLTTIRQTGGSSTFQSNMTTLTMIDGDCTILAGTLTTLALDGGAVHYRSTGTLGTCTVVGGATLDLSQDMRSRTITTLNVYAGATVSDPFNTLGSQAFTLVNCSLPSVKLDMGINKTYTLS